MVFFHIFFILIYKKLNYFYQIGTSINLNILENTLKSFYQETNMMTKMISKTSYDEFAVYDMSDILDMDRIHDNEYLNSMHIQAVRPKSSKYIVLKYKKESLRDETDLEKKRKIGYIRSVVYDTENKCIVSNSPSKSIDIVSMNEKDKISPELPDTFRVEEYVEGTMINVFWNDTESNSGWIRSTRSVIGAQTAFYNNTYHSSNSGEITPHFKKSTYSDMFDDCLHASNFSLDRLDKNFSYSFLIQHPINKIVTQVHSPKLYLCGMYHMQGSKVFEKPLYRYNANGNGIEFSPAVIKIFKQSSVCIPYVDMSVKNVNEAILKYQNTEKTHFSIQGIFIKKGNQTFKIRNPNNKYVRELRGNQSKIQYHFYELRRENKIREFLTFFPEYSLMFSSMEKEINLFAQTLYYMYHMCYRFKTKELSEIPYEFRNHVWELHRYYLTNLRPMRQGIQFKHVMKHLSMLEPARLMFSINFGKRSEPEGMAHMCGYTETFSPNLSNQVSHIVTN